MSEPVISSEQSRPERQYRRILAWYPRGAARTIDAWQVILRE
jgi:hypothetical protein